MIDPAHLITALICFAVGYRLPDIDLAPVLFVRHRSAFTHGPLVPWACWWAAGQWPTAHSAAVGLLAGLALHLLADCFPRAWAGSALINWAPLRLTLPPVLSVVYLALSAVLAGWWCLVLLGLENVLYFKP